MLFLNSVFFIFAYALTNTYLSENYNKYLDENCYGIMDQFDSDVFTPIGTFCTEINDSDDCTQALSNFKDNYKTCGWYPKEDFTLSESKITQCNQLENELKQGYITIANCFKNSRIVSSSMRQAQQTLSESCADEYQRYTLYRAYKVSEPKYKAAEFDSDDYKAGQKCSSLLTDDLTNVDKEDCIENYFSNTDENIEKIKNEYVKDYLKCAKSVYQNCKIGEKCFAENSILLAISLLALIFA